MFLVGWLHSGAHDLKRLPPHIQPYHAALPQRVEHHVDVDGHRFGLSEEHASTSQC